MKSMDGEAEDGGGGQGFWRRGRREGNLVVLRVVVIMVFVIPFTSSFNLEPRAATIYSYPYSDTQVRSAYFGYAVGLRYSAEEDASWVIVGAPRANSSYHDELKITEPGAVFTCPFLPDRNATCNELNVDPTGNDIGVTTKSERYKDLKNHGWLGGSLDTQPQYSNDRQATIVCAPLWKNQLNASQVYVNGACYWARDHLSEDIEFKKELPLLDRREQKKRTTYINAYGEAGFSVHFPSNSRKMIVGAPGVVNWTGSILVFEDYEASIIGQQRKKREASEVFDDRFKVQHEEVKNDEFMGYALTSGMFLDPNEELFAAGAPRSADGAGKVVMFKYGEFDYEEASTEQLQGQQYAEYFGAALTAGDINGDGLTDLVVGAPTFSSKSIADMGRIHVYLSEQGRGLSNGPQHYYGRKVSISRFGSTLAAADLNMDTYQDIIVGAPWEEDKGAVYIFQGSSEGLRQPHSQYISPEDFTPGLRGFGMALSRGIDVDQNGYPDLAIGSIMSDNAVLVRSRPIAVLRANITATPRIVQFDEEAVITVKACIHYEGHRIPQGVKVEAILTLDHQSRIPRATLTRTNTSSTTLTDDLIPDKAVCWEEEVYIKKEKLDPDLAIAVKLDYALNSSSVELMTQPIVDPQAPSSIQTDVSISKGCKEDVCKVDMWTEAAFLDGNNSSVVIGKANKLEVVIYNRGEHVYLPNMTVSVAPPLVVYPPSSHDCTFLDMTHKAGLVCKLPNPMTNMSEPERILLNVWVDEKQRMENSSHTRLEVHVAGEGEEQEPDDNTVALSLQLATQAELQLHGSSLEEQVAYEHKEEHLIVANNNLTFNHTYILLKKGPTPLKKIDLVLEVPVSFSNGEEFVDVMLGETRFSGHINCTWRGLNATGKTRRRHVREAAAGDDTQDDIVVEAQSRKEVGTQYFNCSSDDIRCAELHCKMNRWPADIQSAKVTVKLEVNLAVLAKRISVRGGAVLGSRGRATIHDLDPQLAFIGKREATSNTVTSIQPEMPSGVGVPWWVIVLAVLGGLLLMGLLVYALYKSGFFKRKELEEMKAQRAKLERAPTGVSNPAAFGD